MDTVNASASCTTQTPKEVRKQTTLMVLRAIGNIMIFTIKTLFKSILCILFSVVVLSVLKGINVEVNFPLFTTILVALIVWDIASRIAELFLGKYISLSLPVKEVRPQREEG